MTGTKMKQEFDFETVGKRLPYSVPEGFFEANARAVLASVERSRRHRLRTALIAPLSVVAAAAVAWGVFVHIPAQRASRQSATAQQTTIDGFVNSLSDKELTELDNAMSVDTFLSSTPY